jgi:hypothetical protein
VGDAESLRGASVGHSHRIAPIASDIPTEPLSTSRTSTRALTLPSQTFAPTPCVRALALDGQGDALLRRPGTARIREGGRSLQDLEIPSDGVRAQRHRVRRLVAEVGTEPALHFLGPSCPFEAVVDDLVAVDLAQGEVARLRMREVEPAHARPGPHGERLGDPHAGVLLDVEELQSAPFSV